MKKRIADIIRGHKSFEVITHEGPDEDAVGSSRALAHGLISLGKSVKLVYPSRIPDSLLFTSAPKHSRKVRPQISILVDVSDMKMLGGIKPQGEVVVIDHHKTNNGFGEAPWIDSSKSSAAEMVYDLFCTMGVEITPAIASNLYMGLFGDTGGFIHVNTTPRVFRVAYELTRAGADPNLIAYKLRRTKSITYFQILCAIMERLVISGGVYGSYIAMTELNRLKARPEDATGIVEEIASLGGAELVIFLRELDPDTVHCSMRSKSGESALNTAKAFGGGGHGRAAGFTIKGRACEVIDDVIEEGLKWANKA